MMQRNSALFLFCALLFFTTFGPVAQAQDDSAQQLQQLQAQLEQLTDSAADNPRKLLLQQLITALQNKTQLQNQISSLQTEIEQQPDQLKSLNQTLAKGYADKQQPNVDRLDIEQLDHLITTLNARMLELAREQALQQKQQTQAEQNQQSIREQLTSLKLEQESAAQPDTNPELTDNAELRKQLRDLNFEQQGLKVQALELELLALPRRAEIAKLTWQILENEREAKSEQLSLLREVKQARQRSEAEQALQQLDDLQQNPEAHPLLVGVYQENKNYSAQLREMLAGLESADLQRSSLQQRLTILSTTFRSIAQQLELEVSHISPEQRRFIFRNRDPIESGNTVKEINLQRLQNTLLEQELTTRKQQYAALPLSVMADLSPTEQPLYRQLLGDQVTLISRIIDARQQLVNELNLILSIQNEINQQIESNSQLLSEQLLWNPVSDPINMRWPRELLASVTLLLDHWQQEQTESLLTITPRLYPRIALLLLLAALILWLRSYQQRHQESWAKRIGNVVSDRFHHTVLIMVIAVATTMLLPAALWITSNTLINPLHPDADTLKAMLFAAAVATLVVHSLRNWLKSPSGLFTAHFGISESLNRVLRRRLGILYVTCLPLLLIQIYLWNIDADEIRSGLTRLVMFALIAIITALWASLWRVKRELNRLTETISWWSRAELWLTLLVGFNIAMLVLTAAGYTFSVNVLMYAVLQTLLVLLVVIVAYKLGLRWVLLAERRLEFDRANARRAEILAAREKQEEEPPLETNYLNLQTISDHSRTLLKTATLVLLVVMLWGFLGGFLPFFGALDNVVLWSSLDADGATVSSVTLKNVLFGFVVLGLSLLAAYNLPGLLELLILQNIDLTPGTGYALSSLIKYVLIMVGILGAFANFGLEWGKLQWLVAALGVGLGFGLQEIVANFVSGLIILFEKPVRIGDTVTIDNLTGTVTRIQIRATTIVDWDRKEVIIPNKTFITQQLINWSLTDSVTRVVIPVGVAYGSDTEQARALLLEAAIEEARVLKDPKPEAFFTAFGDSTLNLELRLHVASMADRLEVTHKVNTAIAAKFKTAGLEIAFPQLDVHLHRAPRPAD